MDEYGRPRRIVQPSHLALESISRRSLLKRGAALAAVGMTPALLAACGGGGGSSSSASTSSGDTGKIGGRVGFIGYEGTDFSGVLGKFYKQNGITIAASYIGALTEIPPKFAAGGGSGVELINYSAPSNQWLQESGVELEPLDLDRLPNWKNVEEFIGLTGAPVYSNADGEIVAVPFGWGALGINYDSSQIPEPKSWEELKGPAFKNKLAMIDDPAANYTLAAEVLGFSCSEMTEDQLEEANEYLKEILVNVKQVSPTYGDLTNLIASGEVTAIFAGWSALNLFAAEAGNPDVKTNVEPEEGGGLFVEQYGMTKGAENADTIYAIMNEVLDVKVNGEASGAVLLGSTCKGAQKYQSKEIAELYKPESDYRSYFGKQSVSLAPPAVSDEFVTFGQMVEAWTRIKTES